MPSMPNIFAKPSSPAVPLYLVASADAKEWLKTQGSQTQNSAASQSWIGKLGQILCVTENGLPIILAIGLGDAASRRRNRFGVVANIASLPEVILELIHQDIKIAQEFALGFLLSKYRFTRYAPNPSQKAELICPAGVDERQLQAIIEGEFLTRDLINTPANDMGPDELEAAARDLADEYGAQISVVTGQDLIAQNFPMIHAVGRASLRAPRLIDMTWGSTGPRLTLVGKGVCFDTGGLNIKPGTSMGLMKKDMGGAAHVMGLAKMIMATNMPVQLRMLIPAVENAIGGDAFRPQDILTSRKGLTVEINNTDAEGRLVLADALALADETPPDLMICMATLTGAARVAVGPDIAPYFTKDASLSHSIATAASSIDDPVWQLPLHAPYEAMIEPGIADLDNAPAGGFAGATTAALFLHRFVTETTRFVHFDCYGWQPNAAPARPKGGVGQGTRALFQALPDLLNL
jgi:leucyl aminopeptidase